MGLRRLDGRHLGALVVEQLKRSDAFGMVLSALLIVAIPGALVNNLQNSGSVPTPQTGCPNGEQLSGGACMSCSNGVCYIVQSVGCQTTPPTGTNLAPNPNGNCALSGSAVSFLNYCSPFTALVTWNFLGFVSSFFADCGFNSAQSLNSSATPNNFNVNTVTFTSCATGNVQQVIYVTTDAISIGCTHASQTIEVGGAVITIQGAQNCYDNGTGNNGCDPIYVTLGGGSLCPTASSWNGVIQNATANSVSQWVPTCLGAYVLHTGAVSSLVVFDANCSVYGDYSGQVGNTGNWPTSFTCNSFSNLQGLTTGPTGLYYYLPTIASSLSWSSILSFGLFVMGAILLIFIGLGVGFNIGGSLIATGGQFGVTNNPQGSKLAQAFGVGMLIWGAFTSEFLFWTNYLPYGMNILMPLGLTALMFFGMWQLSQTPTVTS